MCADCNSGGPVRRPVVGVLGSGTEPLRRAVAERCRTLGELLARRGCHLLTGGGLGVMAAVSRAFVETPGRGGLALAVLPGDAETGEPPAGYPNPFVELAIRTHLPARGERGGDHDSRNHLNVLSADAVIALAGGAGTVSEVRLALRYGRPVLVLVGDVLVDDVLVGDVLVGDVLADDVERELPGCPVEVPRAVSLEAVEVWLDRALRSWMDAETPKPFHPPAS
ncbi:MAG TPA: molybdenum cofactor carrier protein [Thermoanaerobaculia bacterium]|nr:molybdenum cofactor carrier protein [Thermoanaerobaculia bacterium]